jgi:hypothetical protein
MGGWLLSFIVISVFVSLNRFSTPLLDFILPITVINLTATITESLPIRDFDNLLISATSVLTGYLFF